MRRWQHITSSFRRRAYSGVLLAYMKAFAHKGQITLSVATPGERLPLRFSNRRHCVPVVERLRKRATQSVGIVGLHDVY
jgi:hypothetical protein